MASVAVLAAVAGVGPASASGAPSVKVSSGNTVPACATPGRLQAYLATRNTSVPNQFDSIAVEYMKHGEELGVRWDYAFFQMLVETGSLSFKNGNRSGDVRPTQNNFAGLGATGNGERGESFPDVSTGVRAHLEHILLYAGAPVDNPVAERTRKVHEWGILTNWHKGFKRPITFADLGQKWAPGTRSYFGMIDGVADKFYDEHCKAPDPKPELVALARGQSVTAV
ncbi:MAG TPA: glucosaminidase domain-containing protein, partial [Hyphomicrobiaceae bacterium]|nr:glucosaminidase domain-containing protein [Hyphomicrobiaceae bacterium]